jgi:hypothetical protein
MKKIAFVITFWVVLFFGYAQEIPPYYNGGNIKGSIEAVSKTLAEAIENKGFEIIGSYNPEGNRYLKVLVFTRQDLQEVCSSVKDRGMLSAALKVGLKRIDDGKTLVTLLNPEYLFYGYLRDAVRKNKSVLMKVNKDAKEAIKSVDGRLIGFGGSIDKEELTEYHYMPFMPYFGDPVTVGEFDSFEEGYAKIKANLAANKGGAVKVYEIYKPSSKSVVFGVGMLDKDDGEAFFLPIIGEKNLAALPYEIILTNKKATILHGKFRFALLWPELSMSEFMKIVSTPGYVEDFMKDICK